MYFYSIMLFSLAFILVGFYAFLHKRINVSGVRPFIICVLLVAVWNSTYSMELLSYTLKAKVIWFIIRMAFILYIPAFWLMITLELTDRRNFKSWKNSLLVIMPTISAFLILTSSYNNWFIYNFYLEPSYGYKVLRFATGSWFWVNAAYNYLLNTVNIGLLMQAVFSKQYIWKKQAIIMIIGMLIPIISDIMLVGNLGFNKNLDFTPISFLLSLLVTAFGMFKYRFMDIVPVAQEYAFDDMNELMIILNQSKKIVDMNKKALKMFNTSIPEVIGTPIHKVIQDITKYDFSNPHNSAVKIGLNYKFAEKEFYYYGSINVVKGSRCNIVGYLILLEDITELTITQQKLEKANEELWKLNQELYNKSIKDGLTEMYNKKHIIMLLGKNLQKAIKNKIPLIIAIFDIDYFKRLNDNYGHLVGDSVLKKVAELIRAELGDNGTVGRFGGEEFLIFMPNVELNAGGKLCDKIRFTISNYKFEYDRVTVTISAGVSQLKSDDDINSLIKRADDCLYKAKANGRNKIELEEQ
ncbi:histidine kinase N-terminal 7TM domain-containing protein [Clostridium kluyveri]|uniref:histidine kinase N-terminal 7TM domain-containing diguanylate cyclase n=1 Tax=Clostridium kluyveri TaxID=1534 RepID=UPI0022462B01|nr:histidine kinase N-terminal 7TM domain-containing protein [Clostridium kluyveri]UZQ52344.1 diguanylate cyclase [Clostridium kluyveri]